MENELVLRVVEWGRTWGLTILPHQELVERAGEPCAWCSREGIVVTKKGLLSPHVTASGARCIGLHVLPHVQKEKAND